MFGFLPITWTENKFSPDQAEKMDSYFCENVRKTDSLCRLIFKINYCFLKQFIFNFLHMAGFWWYYFLRGRNERNKKKNKFLFKLFKSFQCLTLGSVFTKKDSYYLKSSWKKAQKIKQSRIASIYKIGKVKFEKKNTFFHSVKLFPLYVDIEFA